MTSEEEYQQRQDDEFQVLQAMYGEENVEDVTEKNAWKVSF